MCRSAVIDKKENLITYIGSKVNTFGYMNNIIGLYIIAIYISKQKIW